MNVQPTPIFERSSGYAGYRCPQCATWKYEADSTPWKCDCTPPIVVRISEDHAKDAWAYGVTYGTDPQSPMIAIGWGHDYLSASKLANQAIKKFKKSHG